MDWQKIREMYPKRWVLVEAIDAYTEHGMRVVPSFALIDAFSDDWYAACDAYKSWHQQHPEREFYVIHTENEKIEISTMDAFFRMEEGNA
jgi:hypothetical protein